MKKYLLNILLIYSRNFKTKNAYLKFYIIYIIKSKLSLKKLRAKKGII